MFLSFAGIAFYSVDAFFNFPIDRPEILVLFSFSLATGIAVIKNQKAVNVQANPELKGGQKVIFQALAALAILMMLLTAYLFRLNYQSSRLQRIAFEEIKSGKLKSPADLFLKGFPGIPNININGEPIDVVKSRYLLNENRNEEAIELLRAEKASPWDGRREYFLSMGFNNLNMIDSAVAYAEKLRKLKPKHVKNSLILCQMLEDRDETDKVKEYMDEYLAGYKKNNNAWVLASGVHYRTGDTDRAWEIISEAKKYLPNDELINQQYNFLYQKKFVDEYRPLYAQAREEMDRKNYDSALELINEYIGHVPDDFYAHQVRAYIYYYQKEFNKSIEEITHTLTLPGDNPGVLYNLRGVCYHGLNDMNAACKDFEAAMNLGEPNGKANFERFCKNRK
jgi:tetratricopeptide (TPR) repeat protein